MMDCVNGTVTRGREGVQKFKNLLDVIYGWSLGAQPADDALDRRLDDLDLGARDPQLEVVEVLQTDPLYVMI